jgi:tetratricopeptide (TPR) repeat protein
LGAAATRPAPNTATADGFDEGQTWRDAVNAFHTDDHEEAARLAEQLLAHAPYKGAYHLLAARASAELERWDEAEQHARWLLEDEDRTSDVKTAVREIESWQRDWAHVVLAKVCRHTGRVEQARAILQQLLQAEPSPHAQAAAERLLAEINQADEGNEWKP